MPEGFGRREYYRLLQVDPDVHPEIVRAAYRTLLRVLGKHPDVGVTTARRAPSSRPMPR
ncbi:MAG TPA: J domain-containing protein [Methylomirabilota bacterium]|nr:J domain-containing protein [Methylomirabilota bacterium]